jgi:hypothetical protein
VCLFFFVLFLDSFVLDVSRIKETSNSIIFKTND